MGLRPGRGSWFSRTVIVARTGFKAEEIFHLDIVGR